MQLKQFVILQSSAFVDAIDPERTLNLYVGDLVDLASRHLNTTFLFGMIDQDKCSMSTEIQMAVVRACPRPYDAERDRS